jgi:hypothetical protein
VQAQALSLQYDPIIAYPGAELLSVAVQAQHRSLRCCNGSGMINGRVSSIVLTGSAGEWLNPFLVTEKMMEPVHDPINVRIVWRRRQ